MHLSMSAYIVKCILVFIDHTHKYMQELQLYMHYGKELFSKKYLHVGMEMKKERNNSMYNTSQSLHAHTTLSWDKASPCQTREFCLCM